MYGAGVDTVALHVCTTLERPQPHAPHTRTHDTIEEINDARAPCPLGFCGLEPGGMILLATDALDVRAFHLVLRLPQHRNLDGADDTRALEAKLATNRSRHRPGGPDSQGLANRACARGGAAIFFKIVTLF